MRGGTFLRDLVRLVLSITILATALGLATAPASSSAIERLYGRSKPALPAQGRATATRMAYETGQAPGTIIIDVGARYLYLIEGTSSAIRYRISVGRDGFGWSGTVFVQAKKEWPEWRPPAEMRVRQPELPEMVPAGPYNPLGARALYLFRGGRDTLYRIHGTNNAPGVGTDGTSGCFRLTNTDIIDLYRRVGLGTKVIVK